MLPAYGALLSEGRTLFLVSHSETDLRRFGTRGLYLRAGELVMDGPMDEVLARYNHDLGARGWNGSLASPQSLP